MKNDLLYGCKFFHIICSFHELNHTLLDGLKINVDSLHKIREGITFNNIKKYVTTSQSRKMLLGKCVDSLGLGLKAGMVFRCARAIKYHAEFANLQKFDGKNYKFLHTYEEWSKADLRLL